MVPTNTIAKYLIYSILLLVSLSSCASNISSRCSSDTQQSETSKKNTEAVKNDISVSSQPQVTAKKIADQKSNQHSENDKQDKCALFLPESATPNTLFFTGTGCDQFGLKKKDCALEATISAQAQLATVVRSKISSECNVETTIFQTAENTYVESKMVCLNDVKTSEVNLNQMITNIEKCFDSKFSGKDSFRTEVYRAHVRLTVPLANLQKMIKSAEQGE
jgi:hypothetical protein